MAVPFRRKSKTRIKKGRWPKILKFQTKIKELPIINCKNCNNLTLRHFVCSGCKKYK